MLTFFLLLLIGELPLNFIDFFGRYEVAHVVADADSVQVASHVIGKPNAIVKSIGAIGALLLHALECLRIILRILHVSIQEALCQEVPQVFFIGVVAVVVIVVHFHHTRRTPVPAP